MTARCASPAQLSGGGLKAPTATNGDLRTPLQAQPLPVTPASSFNSHSLGKKILQFLHQAQLNLLDSAPCLNIARIFHLVANEFVSATQAAEAEAIPTRRSGTLGPPNHVCGHRSLRPHVRPNFLQ